MERCPYMAVDLCSLAVKTITAPSANLFLHAGPHKAHGDCVMSGLESWVAQVANYQQLYVRPTVEAAGPVDRSALTAMINSNLERPVPIPDFEQEGVIFRRGQLLQVDGNPLIQLAYLPASDGLPVAFCIMKDPGAKASPPDSGISHGLNYQSWNQEGLRFVLLGSGSKQQIEKLSQLARDQINAS